MPSPRDKTIVLLSGILGLAVLVTAGFAFRDRLVEEYWLWKLERGDEGDREVAARRLGEMKSTRAIPGLLRWVASAKRRPEEAESIFFAPAELVWSEAQQCYVFQLLPGEEAFNEDASEAVYGTVRAAFLLIGDIAIPQLTEVSREQNGDSSLRFWAKAMLGELKGKPVLAFARIIFRDSGHSSGPAITFDWGEK